MSTRPNSKSKLSSQQQELLKKRLAQRQNRIPRQTHDGTAPASLAQNRLWLENELVPDSPTYNIARRWQLNGRLHIPALEKSFNTVIARHEALRTTFALQDDQIVQKIQPQLVLSLPVTDLMDLSEADRANKVEMLATEEAKRPFNLTTGPLIRAQLLRLAAEEQVLLFTLHHIIADGWSMNLFIRELTHLYRAYANDETPNLPPPAIQYADFAHWQEQQLQGPRLQKQRDYWLDQLNGLPAYLDLPTDRPRPNPQTFDGAIDTFTIPAALAAPLKALSQREGTTLFMTLLAAFEILLARYSGQKEIAIGTPVAGRSHPDLENSIGFFVNTVVLRGRLDGDPTFRSFLDQTRQVVLAALSHQDVSFAQLVEALKPDRNLNHSPIFQVLFTLQNSPDTDYDLPGLDSQLTVVHSETAKYDLTLFVKEMGDELECTWEYNTALFDQATMRRMAANWQRLLAGILANLDQSVQELPLMSDDERQQVLVRWNDTAVSPTTTASLPQQFMTQAARTPQAIAIQHGQASLTYAQLNQRTNQLAHRLQEQGVGPDVPVALCLERSIDMMVALLAVLKAGGCYLPLDPAYPANRLAVMLADTRPPILLTQSHLADRLPAAELPATVFYLDRDWDDLVAGQADCDVETAVHPNNLAYIIYTSGSTGQPKGVMLTQRALHNLINWQLAQPGHDQPLKTLQFASLSFDVSFQETFATWLTGGTLLLIDESQRRDLPQLLALLDQQAVQRIFVPFVALNGLAEAVADGNPLPRNLVQIATAGEQLQSSSALRGLLTRLSACTLQNHYGPSETHAISAHTLAANPETWPALPPIGRPLTNSQLYILDSHLEPVPIGVAGELYLGGIHLARGYKNRPGLTAERFLPNPFSRQPGERLYKTGDWARYLPNGDVQFLGRLDNQVKIRGYRIEQGEIETVLSQHPAVRQGVVQAHTAPTGDKYLAAYVLLEEEDTAVSSLRQFLTQHLPDYMIPTIWLVMDAFPLTASGKVDRRALPEPDFSQRPLTTEFAQPATPAEIALAEIWSEVLGIEQVSIHDNFFELGGHSLLATRIMARIRDRLQQDVPLMTLFQFPTIAGLTKVVAPEIGLVERPLIDPTLRQKTQQIIIRNGRECAALPVSFAQQRLWLLDQLEPNSPLYNIPLAIDLQGNLDKAALQSALTHLIGRHESLRTTFERVNEIPMQLIHPAQPLDMAFVDGQQRSAEEINQRIAVKAGQPFNLQTGPLLRAALFQHDATRHTLLLVFHHIITDGQSIPIFMDELTALYEEYAAETPASLTPLPVQYADFALWQRQWLQGERQARQLAYWQAQLANAPTTLDLPTDRPRPFIKTYAGDNVHFNLPPQLIAQLKTMSNQFDVTPFMIALTAFYILLYRYTKQTDIVVGSPTANRTIPEQEALIGFFVNMLALRIDLSGNPTVETLLAQVRDTVLAAQARQDVPFEKLIDALNLERALSHSPLFQVAFTYEMGDGRQIERPSLTWNAQDFGVGLVKYDLSIWLRETKSAIEGAIAFNTTLFDRATIERMAANWQTLLTSVLTHPRQPVAALPLLSAGEQQQLTRWNNTRIPYPQEATVHTLFEIQAAQTPQQTALIFAGEPISYDTLNRRANQLARHLRRLGVGPDVLVGLSLERSVEMIVGILAILKAGGAYLPLDAAYPPERQAFMLQDGQVAVMLTHQSLCDNLPTNERMTVLCLDSEWAQMAGESEGNLVDTAVPSNLAYVMYTSGSTGQPKGVAITHQNIIRLVKGANYANLTADETFLQVAPISFDAATLEIWGSLLNGARLVIAPPQKLSLDELAALVQAEAVTTLWLTAGLFHLAVDDHLAAFSGVRQLLAGGDVLAPPRVQRVLQELPNCQMINGYGPTENTTFTTCCSLAPTEVLDTAVPIGAPVANTQVYILDENLALVPVGVAGELYAGGDGLARGYLNQPGLTAVSFIPNPFADKPGQRLYRTGDLARWLPDSDDRRNGDGRPNGRIEFLGRRDSQVKIRGYRIEQGEIEAILSQHPAVRQSVVLARTASSGDKYLAAYVLSQGQAATVETTAVEAAAVEAAAVKDLRQYLRQRLPDYMVPTSWMMMDAFPLDHNGKVDRHALPEINLSQRQLTTELAPPTTPTEIALAEIWRDVLNIEQISIHDNFFELGGHSLLATRIMTRVQDRLQQKAPLLTLFKFPTIAGLAKALEPEPMLAERPLIDTSLRQEMQQIIIRDGKECIALPASFAQQRLFSLDQLEPNSPLYNVPLPIELQGELDETALQLALTDLIARHESLRTTFELIDDIPMQVIHPAGLPDMPFVDGSGRSTAEIEQQITDAARQPFNLQAGPLLRATLFQHDFDKHTLLLVLHHIITDGWSIPILLNELIALYEESAEGTLTSLPPMPIQYADFALWQRQWLQGERLAEKLQYWHEQLANAPAALELPTSKPRSSAQTFAGANVRFHLPSQLTARLHTLGRQLDMTPYMITLAAFYVMLYRYTGQSDIVVGSATANRTVPEQEGLIGFFVNMLALRANLSGNPTMTALLTHVRDTVLAAQARQDVPFEKLVDDLGLERTLSHSPLFQVSFAYEMEGYQPIERPFLTWTPKERGVGLVKYDLLMGLRETGAGVDGIIAYNADLFDPTAMQRMADHYMTLLEAALTQPDQPIASLPLLTAVEQQTQQQWNDAARYDTPDWQSVPHRVVSFAQNQPEKLALASETAVLTYGELNRQANQLAHYLLQQGVTTETVVAICLERSPLTAVAALAVWKAGGAYVPLDPAYPADRLEFMLADSQALLLLTTRNADSLSAKTGKLPALQSIVWLDDWQMLAGYPDHNPPTLAGPDNLAYLIYTSGSTGQPKGAGITQRSLVNMAAWHVDTFQLTAAAKTSLVSGPAFDASVWELWPSLAAGASLFIPDDDVRLMPDKMRDWLVAQQITHSFQPTPLADNMVNLPWPEETALRLMTTGGDVLHHYPPETLPFTLVNNYGPTENTVNASTMFLNPTQKPATLPPIGQPSGNTQIYLLDAYLQLVPVGVVGELYIGGAGLARGYWQRPSLTAASFIPNPFSQKRGERLYRTGDLARYLSDDGNHPNGCGNHPNGCIEFMGRIDQQVKIRGFRIELGEIETILSRHAGIREAAVIVHEDDNNHKRLIAYPVITDPALTTDQLRAYLQSQLPAYMVPATFVPIDAIPLTSNGKIDRAALPVPDRLPELIDAYVAPETAVEHTLTTIWQTVLGLNRIGIRDNFFELGGDSILSIRIVAKAKDAGLSLTVRQLFQQQTIAELAAVVGVGEETAVTPSEIITDQPAPLTPIQRWFFEKAFAQPNQWNMALLLEVKRPLQKAALEQAVSALIAQHDVLRMQFEPTEHGWQQRHTPQANGGWLRWFTGVIDPSELIAQQQASLSITDGPLFRAAYFDRVQQPHQLLLVVHHLVMDGVSWRILLEDLQTAYEQLERGTAVTLPAKTTSFQKWAQTLTQHVQNGQFTPNLDYWLNDTPAPNLIPLGNPTGSNTMAAEAIMSYALTPAETEALLHEVPTAYNTRIDEVLLTAVAQAHQTWTGSQSLPINLEGHGREEILPNADITRTIGWFTTLYPVQLHLSATGQPGDDLKAIKEQVRQIPNRGIEYGLLRYLHPDHDLRAKLAARETAVLSFNYLGQFNEQTDAGLFRIVAGANDSSFAPENQRPHIVDVNGSIHNQQLHLNLHYSRELHHKQTIAQFGDELMRRLRGLIKHCQSPQAQGYTPSDFDKIALDQGELDDLLAELDGIL
jgi:amino acid adenylation domain-containing protein/non-ribosomal peptide synthase protein (TIGR01720 family)